MDEMITPPANLGVAQTINNKRWTILVLVVAVIVIIIAAIFGYIYWSQNSFVASIKKSLAAGDYQTALTKLSPEVSKHPQNAEFLALQSLALSQESMNTFGGDPRTRIGYNTQALQDAQSATQADAKNSDAWRALGDAYFVAQNWTQAHTAFQKASTLNPRDAFIAFDDAQTYFFEGDVNNAQLTYQKALTIDPTLVRADAGIGRIDFDRSFFATSTTEFQKAYSSETNPHLLADDAYYLGALSMQSGDFADAKTYFTKGTTLEASSSLPWLGLGTWDFTIVYSTSTEAHSQIGTQSPISLLANSFADIGTATANDPNLLAAKVEIAYQLSMIGNSAAAKALMGIASSTQSSDLTINPEERSILLNRLTPTAGSTSSSTAAANKK